MTVYGEVLNGALIAEKRWLMAVRVKRPAGTILGVKPVGRFVTEAEADRLLRIEMDDYGIAIVMEHARELPKLMEQVMAWRAGEGEGPLVYNGVDVYPVPKLPPPGWRIVNPLKVRA